MPKETIFIGGGDYRKKENAEVDTYLLGTLKENAKVVFLPFAVKEIEKRESRARSISEALGTDRKLIFSMIDENTQDSKEIIGEIEKGDAVFLLGGDPLLLLAEIKRLGLVETLVNFEGILIGYSAGAMIFSDKIIIPGGMDERYPEDKISEGLGIFNFSIIPHYSPEHKEVVQKLSKVSDIYALPNKSALVMEKGKKKEIGEVLYFRRKISP